MSPVCPNCGEGYPPGRLACPHCGADEVVGWKADDTESGLDLPGKMDEDSYSEFLADEGLAARPPARRRKRARLAILCLAVLLVYVAGEVIRRFFF